MLGKSEAVDGEKQRHLAGVRCRCDQRGALFGTQSLSMGCPFPHEYSDAFTHGEWLRNLACNVSGVETERILRRSLRSHNSLSLIIYSL